MQPNLILFSTIWKIFSKIWRNLQLVEIMEEKQRSISTVFLTEPVTGIEIIHLEIYVAYVCAESFVEI